MAFPSKMKSHGPGLVYILVALVVVAIAGAKFFGFAPSGTSLEQERITERQPAEPPANRDSTEGENSVLPPPSAMTQVLVYHAHTTENYMPKEAHAERGPGDVTAVGKALVAALAEEGIGAVHIVTVHDLPEWKESLQNARQSAQKALGRHDGVRVVLDIHRDAIPGENDPGYATVTVEGEDVARLLFLVGTTGNSLAQSNIKYAKSLQERLEALAPGSTRGVRVLQQEANGDLHQNSVTVYVGDYRDNTVKEAAAAARWLGRAIAQLLREDG